MTSRLRFFGLCLLLSRQRNQPPNWKRIPDQKNWLNSDIILDHTRIFFILSDFANFQRPVRSLWWAKLVWQDGLRWMLQREFRKFWRVKMGIFNLILIQSIWMWKVLRTKNLIFYFDFVVHWRQKIWVKDFLVGHLFLIL